MSLSSNNNTTIFSNKLIINSDKGVKGIKYNHIQDLLAYNLLDRCKFLFFLVIL